MDAICYVCNNESTDWRRSFTEIKSQHTQTPISQFIRNFLGDFQSLRNIDFEFNCICAECLQKIDDYDWTCQQAVEQEAKLRDLLWTTEAKQLETKEVVVHNVSDYELHDVMVEIDSGDGNDETNGSHETLGFVEENSEQQIEIEVQTEPESKRAPEPTPIPNTRITPPDVSNRKRQRRIKRDVPLVFKNTQVHDPSLAGREMFVRQGERLLTFRLVNPPVTAASISDDAAAAPDSNNAEESPDNTPTKCKLCRLKFDDKHSFEKHMVLHDKKSTPLGCVFCDKTFEKPEQLKRHTIFAHTKKQEALCDFCGRVFTNSIMLNVHRKVHFDEMPYECAHCKKLFKWKKNLEHHVPTHNSQRDRPFACSFCDMRFLRPDHCRVHERRHRENTKTESCPFCSVTFEHKFHLKQHIKRKHNAEMPSGLSNSVDLKQNAVSDRRKRVKKN